MSQVKSKFIENTAVTPGSYTSADITVDAQGRITAAANGENGKLTVNSSQAVSSGGTVTLTSGKARQLVILSGNGGPQATSTTPFGTGSFEDGMEIEVIGDSDTNTIEFPFNDATKGAVGNFSSIVLAKYERAKFIYSGALTRFIGVKL